MIPVSFLSAVLQNSEEYSKELIRWAGDDMRKKARMKVPQSHRHNEDKMWFVGYELRTKVMLS